MVSSRPSAETDLVSPSLENVQRVEVFVQGRDLSCAERKPEVVFLSVSATVLQVSKRFCFHSNLITLADHIGQPELQRAFQRNLHKAQELCCARFTHVSPQGKSGVLARDPPVAILREHRKG